MQEEASTDPKVDDDLGCLMFNEFKWVSELRLQVLRRLSLTSTCSNPGVVAVMTATATEAEN